MKRNVILILAVAMLATVAGCCSSNQSGSVWENEELWYDSGRTVCDSLADVFYIVSTDVLRSWDEDGNPSMRACLDSSEVPALKKEMSYMDFVFSDRFNFFSPLYHQFTFECAQRPVEELEIVREQVAEEVREAFDWYMENRNNGRPFILAGFSQGAMMVLDILKHMDEEQYSRMVAAYSIGYRLSAEDLLFPCIKAAQNDSDRGVTISYNSVTRPEAAAPLLTDGAVTCINPMNWKTDGTAAELVYKEDVATVKVDTVSHVLVVEGLDEDKYYVEELGGLLGKGNLHHYDILMYRDQIRENAVLRSYGREALQH